MEMHSRHLYVQCFKLLLWSRGHSKQHHHVELVLSGLSGRQHCHGFRVLWGSINVYGTALQGERWFLFLRFLTYDILNTLWN